MFTEENRHHNWTFYDLDYENRIKWIMKHIKLVEVKSLTITFFKPRKDSRRFSFLFENMKEISVCRLTILNSLWYTNSLELWNVLQPSGSLVKENRGIHSKRKANTNLIKQHIESYYPTIGVITEEKMLPTLDICQGNWHVQWF